MIGTLRKAVTGAAALPRLARLVSILAERSHVLEAKHPAAAESGALAVAHLLPLLITCASIPCWLYSGPSPVAALQWIFVRSGMHASRLRYKGFEPEPEGRTMRQSSSVQGTGQAFGPVSTTNEPRTEFRWQGCWQGCGQECAAQRGWHASSARCQTFQRPLERDHAHSGQTTYGSFVGYSSAQGKY